MNQLSHQTEEILKLAKDIAREYGLGYVGTEHLLLAIVRDGRGLAAEILREHGVNEYTTQVAIDELVKHRLKETWILGRLPGTPHFKDVISKAAAEAKGTSNWQVTPEHLILALLSETGCVGSQALQMLGLTTETVRRAIREGLLAGSSPLRGTVHK